MHFGKTVFVAVNRYVFDAWLYDPIRNPPAEANNQNMRWKRFLYKQVCDRNGGMLCKSPTCGDCSDYAFCFAPESE